MGVIIGETERLSGMVEELLDFSRMQGGRMKHEIRDARWICWRSSSEAVFMFTETVPRREGIAPDL